MIGVLFFIIQGMYGMRCAPRDPDRMIIDDAFCWRVANYLKLTESKIQDNSIECKKRKDFLQINHHFVRTVNKYMCSVENDMNVAADLINSGLDMTFPVLNQQLSLLAKSQKYAVHFLCSKKVITYIILNGDIFTAFCCALPESFDDHAGFFNAAFNEGVQIGVTSVLQQKTNKKTYRRDMTQKLGEMTILKALSAFRYVAQKGIHLADRFDFVDVGSSCKIATPLVHTPDQVYYFTYEDLKDMPQYTEELLRTVVDQSNDAKAAFDIKRRFEIKEEHIPYFALAKKFINRNELFQQAQVLVDISRPSLFEEIRDNLLFGMPYVIIMVLSDWVYYRAGGFFESLLVNFTFSYPFGYFIYPLLDTCNSNVKKLSEWVGSDNHTKMRKGGFLYGVSTMNSLYVAIAQMFVEWGTPQWRIVGQGLLGLRIFVLLSMMSFRDKCDDIFKRSNKEGLPYTLKDVINGPKFSTR